MPLAVVVVAAGVAFVLAAPAATGSAVAASSAAKICSHIVCHNTTRINTCKRTPYVFVGQRSCYWLKYHILPNLGLP